MRDDGTHDESTDVPDFTLEAWYRTVEEVQSFGAEWLEPAESGRQFDLCDLREKREILNRALADLPRRKRLSLLLHYVDRLSVKEIAARLNISESRVPQVRYQALLSLRDAVMKRLRSPRSTEVELNF